MKLIEQKCSNCGARIKKVDDRNYICPYCGTNYTVEKLTEKKENQENPITQPVPISTPTTVAPKSKPNPTCGCLMFFMLFGLAIGLIATGLSGGFDNNSNTGLEASAEAETAFVSMVEDVFGKKFDKVTRKEFESVTAIVCNVGYEYTSGTVGGSCTVNGQEVAFACEGNLSDISKNLYYFTNLESIVTTGSLYESGLAGLDKLTSIECGGQRIDDIAKILPYPENITILKNVYAAQNISAVEKFPNLKVLDISLDQVNDISPLSGLNGLEDINLYVAGDLKDFSALGKLYELRNVVIYSNYLYSTDFLTNLNNLEVLELNGCREVTNIDGLAGKTRLRRLVIVDCHNIANYAPINTLTNLEELHINGYETGAMVVWSNLKNLKILEIAEFNNTYMMNEITKLPALEKLKLAQCYVSDVNYYASYLSRLDNLKYLTLQNMFDFDASVVGDMNNLEMLYIYDVKYLESAERIFDAPNLKEVTLYDGWVFMDFANVNTNDSLEKLSIRYCEFRKGSDGVEFADNVGVLDNFSGLTDLEIRGTKLENVDFVRDLPVLKKLDVTNNYVSDVSAINDCPNIEELWCGDNVISSTPEFSHPVTVHMDEEIMWEYQ